MMWRIVRASAALVLGLVAVVLLSFVLATHADPGSLYVDGATGDDVGSCTDPGSPCGTIGYALGQASGGDTVLVAQGVYTENITVDKEVTSEGGYESAGWTRNITQYETIIDGSDSRTVVGDWDGEGVRMSDIISDAGKYKMWYAGRNLYGESNGIGYAESVDGISWAKSISNPVLTPGASGEWDAGGVEHPHVIKDGSVYKMWYGGFDEDGTPRIGYATSSDGISWTRYSGNPVLDVGDYGEWDAEGVLGPYVLKEAADSYRMWYHGRGDDWQWRIGYATSPDGIHWTKHSGNPVLDLDPGGAWDDQTLTDPHLVYEDGTYKMWHTGHNGDVWAIGYAASEDGIHWTKDPRSPVLEGDPSTWEGSDVTNPHVLLEGGTYKMWYEGGDWPNPEQGYATSPDGITWHKYAGNPVLTRGIPGFWGQPVVQFVGGSDGSVLDGFTVRNGEAEYGGGIFIDGVQAAVHNSVLISNNAYHGGGGIGIVWGADAVISNTHVLSNSVSEHFGGGILVHGEDALGDIRNSSVAHNRGAGWGGGGIVVDYYASATLVSNEIVSNTCPLDNDGGGGIRVNNHSLAEILENIIAYNQAEYGGGIRVADDSSAAIRDNHILSNTVSGWAGGGILVDDNTVASILSNEIAWNTASSGNGGGLRVHNHSQATVSDNVIRSNSANGAGGIHASWHSIVDIHENIVTDNSATDWGGGGMRILDYATAHVDRNKITNNRVGGSGGGIAIGNGSIVTVTNNVIASNQGSDSDGIVIWQGDDDCEVQIVNNTIVSNTAEGIQADQGIVLARNNIIYGNWGGVHNYQSGATVTSDHNAFWDNGWDYEDVTPGAGDISADPLLVNAASEDFHLRPGSPCIDAGSNVGAPDHDFEDDPRPDGCFVDIGADEYRGRTCHRIYLPLMLKNFTPPVTIVWLVRTSPVENAWEQDVVIPAFEAQHPGIKISLLIIDQPDIGPIREEMIRKGQPLHVWSPNWGGDGFASDRHRGWLTDLTPLIERDNFDLSDFVTGAVEMYNIEGHQYALPMLSVGSYVYYNADLFDAAGVAYPPTDWDDTSWTWDGMVAKAISLTHDYGDRDTGQYGAMTGDAMEGPGLIFGQHIFPEGAYDTGLAKESYFDDPKVIQGFQARHDLMYADRVMPDAGIMDALSQLGGAFQSGRLAVNQTGGWGYWNYKGLEGDFCWRVAPVPYGDPAYTGPRAIVYTDPWVITNGTDHLDEAWEFVKYLVGPEASQGYMQATNVPPVRQSLLDEWAEQFSCMTPPEVRECYLGAFDYGIESSNHLMIRWSELDGVYQRWMDIFWNSPTTTASDLLPSLDADFEAILQKIKQEEE